MKTEKQTGNLRNFFYNVEKHVYETKHNFVLFRPGLVFFFPIYGYRILLINLKEKWTLLLIKWSSLNISVLITRTKNPVY